MNGILKKTRWVAVAAAATTLIIIIFTISGFNWNYRSNTYDIQKVINTIKELSSKDYNGRMSGTLYGEKTENYIESEYKKIGLEPCGDNNTYFQKFKGISGNPGSSASLQVMEGEKVIKIYKYVDDYKCVPSFSYNGTVTARGVIVDMAKGSTAKAHGQIALLKDFNIMDSGQNTQPFTQLYETGYRGVIMAGEPLIRRKGQIGVIDESNASKLPRVIVTKKVFGELENYAAKGYIIYMEAAFESKQFAAKNVLGIIKSSSRSNKYLIVSAHMDHLGPDPDGVYFPGALDNASGTAAIIEIARSLKQRSEEIGVNVVFISFSGEEEMLYGSRYYAQNPSFSLDNTRVINIDMIGANKVMPVSILTSGSGKRGRLDKDIIEEFKEIAGNNNYQYEVLNNDSSDHSPFALKGVPAVTIIDLEKTIYHVPEDNISNIGVDNLRRDLNIVMNVIEKEVNMGVKKSACIWIYVVTGSIIIIIAGLGSIVFIKKNKIPV